MSRSGGTQEHPETYHEDGLLQSKLLNSALDDTSLESDDSSLEPPISDGATNEEHEESDHFYGTTERELDRKQSALRTFFWVRTYFAVALGKVKIAN